VYFTRVRFQHYGGRNQLIARSIVGDVNATYEMHRAGKAILNDYLPGQFRLQTNGGRFIQIPSVI